MALTRRTLLSTSALASAGLWIPRRLRAAATPERKFLFVFCRGGWDTTYVYTPLFGNPYASVEDDATTAEVNGITFVDRESRPSVRNFFSDWGAQTCVLNGVEIRSVTHERCRRILLTGSSESAGDDWPSTIASQSAEALVCPHLVVAGPAFTAMHTSAVVRVGSDGQLPDLLGGSAVARGDMAVPLPNPTLGALEDAFVQARAARAVTRATRGKAERFATLYEQALRQMDALGGLADSLDLGASSDGCQLDVAGDAAKVLDCFEIGLSRCGIVESRGWCDSTWDTHSGNQLQDIHFEEFFAYLDAILLDLASRTSPSGAPLSEEVTVVVVSEMGREPTANQWGGKNHWTYTSAMLIGAGVRGGQVLGRLDDNAAGVPIDLESGEELPDGGTSLQAGHLGATLYALAGEDPLEINPQYEAISAAIRT